jgi:hypothetical protein
LLPTSCWFLAWLTLQSLRWRRYIPPKCQLTITGLHDVISQKENSLVTTVRTSNPTVI